MHPNKRKADEFEREVVEVARRYGLEAERELGAGRRDDRGDVTIHLGPWEKVTVQARARKELDLSGAWSKALTQASNAKAKWAASVHKRRGKNAEAAYCVIDWGEYCALLRELVRVKTENDALWAEDH